MKWSNKPKGTFVRWLALMLPIVIIWAMWKVAKIWANIEEERGD